MWYTATSASVTNGATVVAVTTGDDISIIQEDSGLIFEGESPVQVKRGYIDGFGDKFIELASPWPYTDKVSQPIVAYPTDASFAEATAELRRVIDTLEVASTVDMQAATNDTKIATPLKVKQAIDFNTGTAATRDVGESVGNVMEVGAFGVGGYTNDYNVLPASVDLNTITSTGFYTVPSTALNLPLDVSFTMQVVGRATTYTAQILMNRVNLTGQVEVWVRHLTNGIWSDWVKTYHTGNILGTVSQSGGVPTGAIIERGSNVNGSYTKFADGTMICNGKFTYTAPISTSTGAGFQASTSQGLPFPSTFTTSPELSIGERYVSGTARAWGTISSLAVGSFNILMHSFSSIAAPQIEISYTAIGRWY